MWTKSTRSGYGTICAGGHQGKALSAHRISYELHNGPIPVGEGYHGTCVCHECDNRKCVNPDHLYLGPQIDNVHDRDEKGRQVSGEMINTAKLTEVQVSEIRRDYVWRSRTHGTVALGKKYDVSAPTIWCIVNGKSWK